MDLETKFILIVIAFLVVILFLISLYYVLTFLRIKNNQRTSLHLPAGPAKNKCERCGWLFNKPLTTCPRCYDLTNKQLDTVLEEAYEDRKEIFYYLMIGAVLFALLLFAGYLVI
jgi:hypothetical protein